MTLTLISRLTALKILIACSTSRRQEELLRLPTHVELVLKNALGTIHARASILFAQPSLGFRVHARSSSRHFILSAATLCDLAYSLFDLA